MKISNEIQLCFSPEEYKNKNIIEQEVVCQNTFTQCGENELMLDIEVQSSNGESDEKTIDLQVCFAVSENILPIQLLKYCYPAREFVLSEKNCNYNCNYGYRFPLSFVSALYNNMGVTLIFDDQQQSSVGVQKQNDKFQFIVQYNNMTLKNAQRKILIKFHSGDWHQGFNGYKSWYKNKYNQNERIDERLSGCFHIRRYFFNPQFCKNAIYNGKDYCFSQQYHDDQTEVGGVDVALLFDYAYTPQNNIRCGNAQPFKNLKSLSELNRQLQACKSESKLAVYAYFDPYLIKEGSDFDKMYRHQLPILNENNQIYHIWSKDQWHPCISTNQWQSESASYLAKVDEKFTVDGFYLDEMGNGEQFICHNKAHSHSIPLNQNNAEYSYVSMLKNKFPEKLYMCEFFPADSNISLYPSVLSDSKTIVDICRFAFPYKKIFKIIDCDRPIGNNTWDINKIFFNGMGLWLDNDLHSSEWYSPAVKVLIKKHYQILKKYSWIFQSNEIEALVNIRSSSILANRFTRQKETIFTIINVTTESAECYFAIDEKYTDVYDIYNNNTCKIISRNGTRCIKLELGAQEVGCIYAVHIV
ncbi:hypothetical protein SH2C18_01330 [Clostridium sediminicola]|uniref:hypothetical protein n=1 Tax=Clostridium sediminicola TaxID=3114879 RepID=UPI0031F2358D